MTMMVASCMAGGRSPMPHTLAPPPGVAVVQSSSSTGPPRRQSSGPSVGSLGGSSLPSLGPWGSQPALSPTLSLPTTPTPAGPLTSTLMRTTMSSLTSAPTPSGEPELHHPSPSSTPFGLLYRCPSCPFGYKLGKWAWLCMRVTCSCRTAAGSFKVWHRPAWLGSKTIYIYTNTIQYIQYICAIHTVHTVHTVHGCYYSQIDLKDYLRLGTCVIFPLNSYNTILLTITRSSVWREGQALLATVNTYIMGRGVYSTVQCAFVQ